VDFVTTLSYHLSPRFFVKLNNNNNNNNTVVIVGTKGLEDLDVFLKMTRLKTWCEDLNAIDKNQQYDSLFVDLKTYE
jgi:type III restriction enzyme